MAARRKREEGTVLRVGSALPQKSRSIFRPIDNAEHDEMNYSPLADKTLAFFAQLYYKCDVICFQSSIL